MATAFSGTDDGDLLIAQNDNSRIIKLGADGKTMVLTRTPGPAARCRRTPRARSS